MIGTPLAKLLTVSLAVCVGPQRQPSPPPRPPAPPGTPRYDLQLRVAPDSHFLAVRGRIAIPEGGWAGDTLRLMLANNLRSFQVEVVEPATSAGPASLVRVDSIGEQYIFAVIPRRPIGRGRAVVVRFSAVGGEAPRRVFYIGGEGTFASGVNNFWYPHVAGPHGNPKVTGTLRFETPPGYAVAATGHRISGEREARRGRFTYRVTTPVYFAFTVGRYHRVEARGRIPVTLHLLTPRPGADTLAARLGEVVEVLERDFGPYPFEDFSLVEVPTERARAAGFEGQSEGGQIWATAAMLDAPVNLAYYGHEIGHQWWGGIVSDAGFMLSEGVAQYGSLRVVEALEGAAQAERYRRIGYPGYNDMQNGQGYLILAEARTTDRPLAELGDGLDDHLLANSKGFLIFEALAREIGRRPLGAALRRVLREHAWQNVNLDDLERAVTRETGQDLAWFYAQWFRRLGAPDWRLQWSPKPGAIAVGITQTEPHYTAHLELRAFGPAGARSSRDVRVAGAETVLDWPLSFAPDSVVLDPEYRVLRWTPEYREVALALAPYYRARALRVAGKLDEAKRLLDSAVVQVPVPDRHGARFAYEYGLALIAKEQGSWEDAKRHLVAALGEPSRWETRVRWALDDLMEIADTLRDDRLKQWVIEQRPTAIK